MQMIFNNEADFSNARFGKESYVDLEKEEKNDQEDEEFETSGDNYITFIGAFYKR